MKTFIEALYIMSKNNEIEFGYNGIIYKIISRKLFGRIENPVYTFHKELKKELSHKEWKEITNINHLLVIENPCFYTIYSMNLSQALAVGNTIRSSNGGVFKIINNVVHFYNHNMNIKWDEERWLVSEDLLSEKYRNKKWRIVYDEYKGIDAIM